MEISLINVNVDYKMIILRAFMSAVIFFFNKSTKEAYFGAAKSALLQYLTGTYNSLFQVFESD